MDEVKPGWKTSEFWTHILFGVLVVGLAAAVDAADSMPPLAKILVTTVATVALPWLQQQYAKNRKELKQAASAPAAQSLPADPVTAALTLVSTKLVTAVGEAAAAKVSTDKQALEVLKSGG